MLGQNVIGLLFAGQPPSFMPSHDLVSAGRDIGELEAAALIGDRVIRVRSNKHLRVHPNMSAVTAQIHQARGLHAARNRALRKRKWQVKSSRSIHVNGVECGVGTEHLERSVLRNQKDMRDVAAELLVEVAALLGKVHGFATGNVLQIDNGIGHSTLSPYDQPLQVGRLFRFWIANLQILGDREINRPWNRTRPFDRSGNRSAIGDTNDFIIALRKGKGSAANDECDHRP